MHAVIGIDLGTTTIKSVVFSDRGELLRSERAQTPLEKDLYGSVYHPEKLWRVVETQLLRLLEGATEEIDGIVVTGMAEAGLMLEKKSGREASDILPWFDGRTKALARGGDEADAHLFAKTGLHNSYKYGIYKFLWLLNEMRQASSDMIWLSVCDYIVYRLTGRMVTEPGFAARTYVYDIVKRCWDEDRMGMYGLTKESFPALIDSGSIVGDLRLVKAAGSMGSAASAGRKIPVALAGHDHVCAAFGILYHAPDCICDSAGTSETYIGRLAELPKDGPDAKAGLLYGPYPDGGWYYMANVPSSGHSVEWFRKKLQLSTLSYEEMNRMLLQQKAGPTGLLYFPWLTGMGSPWYASFVQGSLLGLSENTDGATVLKAVVEGIQYQAAWVLSILEREHAIGKTDLICAGGSANNPAMMQIKADILRRNVRLLETQEATLAGAAALFYQKWIGSSAASAFLQGALPVKSVVTPDPQIAGAYETIRKKRYLPMADILRQYYETTF